MTEIVRVPFHGTDLLTVEIDGRPHIVLRPVIETLGVSYSSQLTKLKGKSWACVSSINTQLPGDTQSRSHVIIDIRTLLMLLATIEESRVAERVRPLLVAYQSEVADAIESYWTKGVAVRPATELSRLDLIELARAAEIERLELAEQVDAQNHELASARPKAAFVDAFVHPTGDVTTIRVFAKELGIGEKELRDYLTERRRIYRRTVGRRWSASKQREEPEYEWMYHSGFETWFAVRDQPDAPRLHNGQVRTTLYVTPIGKERIRRMLARTPIDPAVTSATVTRLPARRGHHTGGAA